MKKKIIEFPWEILMITVFTVMSVTACSRYTINFDEFYTMHWNRCSWAEFFYEVLHDTSPFLYYYMIRPFSILTGQNIFMARLFSLAALLILLWSGGVFIKKNHGRKAMFFYLAIMYLNPFMLQKSTEIRMYVWASAFTVLAGIFCYKLLVSPARRQWVGFTLFSLLAACTHYYAVLTMVFLYLGLFIWYAFTHNKAALKSWLICSLTTVIIYLPFLLIAVFQIRESNGGWIHEPDSRLAPLKELFYSSVAGTEILYLTVMAVSTAASLLLFVRKKGVAYYWSFICCSALWGITAFGVIFAAVVKPIMLSRYLIMPVCLLFLGIGPVIRHTGKYLLLPLCLSFFLISAIQYKSCVETLRTDHTVDTITFAQEHILEGDKIVLVSGDDYLYNCTFYYIPQAELYYTGSFDPQRLTREENLTEFWFFDNGNYLNPEDVQKAGLRSESFGPYQFGYIHINIYKIRPLSQKVTSPS